GFGLRIRFEQLEHRAKVLTQSREEAKAQLSGKKSLRGVAAILLCSLLLLWKPLHPQMKLSALPVFPTKNFSGVTPGPGASGCPAGPRSWTKLSCARRGISTSRNAGVRGRTRFCFRAPAPMAITG